MTERVRVGVIGTSWWANFMYLPSLKSHPRADVAAICGRARERAEPLAKQYDIPQVFTDYRAMIERAALDAIVIATPDDLHFPMTMAALDAGLHVLCEKPLALNAQQASAMYQKAEASQCKHMVLFTYRWFPAYRHLKQLVHAGYLGQPFDAQFNFLSSYARSDPFMWRLDRRRSHGALSDIGSHMIDLARWTMGEIVSVHARLAEFTQRPSSDSPSFDAANDWAAADAGIRERSAGHDLR